MAHNILTLETAARFMRFTEKGLRQLAMSGEIPCFQQGDRLVFEQVALDNWLSDHFISGQNQGRRRQRKLPLDSPVRIGDYVKPEGVSASIPGHSVSAVLKSLTGLAEKTGLLYDPDEFYRELRSREELGSTAMDNGVALVHPRRRDDYLIESPFVCVARSEAPVCFGNPDGEKTDVFFLIACQESGLHLQMLAGLCQLLAVTSLADDLREARTVRDMLEAVRKADGNKNLLLRKNRDSARTVQ